MLPVFGWKIVERQEFPAVLSQAFSGFVIFDRVLFNEKIKSDLGIDAGFSEPDIFEIVLGFALLVTGSTSSLPVLV